MMIQLPVIPISVDEQQALATLAATITPARALLPLQPTNPHLWRAMYLGLVAEQILWTANLRLVMRIAVDAASRRGEGLEDLFQEGCLALQEAIRRFNPALGFRLSSFAHEHILRRVHATETSTAYVSTSIHFRRVRRRLEAGETPSNSHTSAMALAQMVELESIDNIADPDDAFSRVDEACVDMVELVEPRLRELVRLRYGFGCRVHQQEEVAELLNVSRTTVSRWERRALDQIREALVGGHLLDQLPHGETPSAHRHRAPRHPAEVRHRVA